jgi:molybdopterin molybdotransferase
MAELMDPDVALAQVLDRVGEPRAQELGLVEALGRTLVEPVRASADQPPFGKAMMDGFAVSVQDAGQWVDVIDEVAAGYRSERAVAPGAAIAIMTGAPCPAGTEAVVKVEDTERDGDRVQLPALIVGGQHYQAQGGFCQMGDEIIPAGTTLTSVNMAVIASMGLATVQVAAAPSVVVITTGDELGKPGEPLGAAQIYDSNGPMLLAQARLVGAGETRRLHARDTAESLAQALDEVRDADIVVLTGGVSMGVYDLVPGAVKAAGGEQVFHKLKQKPGKPIFFAVRGEQLLFGLPGTPLGSHLGFHRYVAAAIRQLHGRDPARERRTGVLTEPLQMHGRRILFRLARARRVDGRWLVDPLPWRGSSDLCGPSLSNCYLRFETGETLLEAGDELEFELIDGLDLR